MNIAHLLLLMLATVAGNDDVEWNGVSHIDFQDRRPLCPVGGESFEVQLRTFAGDLSSARVQVDDGVAATYEAVLVGQRGPYDIWAATVPATASLTLNYYLELTDGTDTDYYSVSGMSDAIPVDGGFGLDFATLEHAPTGATPVSGGGTVFKVWAPTRTSAHVRGEFNAWGLGNPMVKVGEFFITHVPTTSNRQMYKYFFNNSVWNSDPRARSLNPSNNLNAHLEDPFNYSWIVEDFDTPSIEEMVIYQLHVGSFAGRNDPAGPAAFPSRYTEVAARVSHLVELGVNAVMLNPITEFAGDVSAGYNPISQWAPEWKFGTPDDFKFMVDTLHQNGIAVLIDIVWNHFSPTDNFLWFYDGSQQYYDDPAVETPWGAQADFDRDEVRRYFRESAIMWFEEYKIDGFRVDGTDFMNQGPHLASGWSLMQWLNDTVDNRYVDKVIIAEQLPDDAWVTRPTSLGGAGFDSQYYDQFTDRLREEISAAAFGDPQMWVLRNIVNGGGLYLEGSQITNYLELHDEAWQQSGGQRFVKNIDTSVPHDDQWAKGRIKLAQAMVMMAPGIPAIVQGSEWLEDTDWGPDFAYRIDWSHKTAYPGIFQYFADIIALRSSHVALRANSARQVFHINESGNVLGFRRWNGGEVVVILANFGNNDYPAYRIGLPLPGTWHERINSQASQYEGVGSGNHPYFNAEAIAADGFNDSAELILPKMGLIVLEKVPDGTPVTELRGSGRSLVSLEKVYPNPISSRGSIAFSLAREERVELRVYDVAGRLVRTLLYETMPAGRHVLQWDGRDGSGRRVASGIYLAKITAAGSTSSMRMAILD